MTEQRRFQFIVAGVVLAVVVAFAVDRSLKSGVDRVEPNVPDEPVAVAAPAVAPQPVAEPPVTEAPPAAEPTAAPTPTAAPAPEPVKEAAPVTDAPAQPVAELDVMKALEWREEWMPSGYSLLSMPGVPDAPPNPGYFSAELLAKVNAQLGQEPGMSHTIAKAYNCMLNNNGAMLNYSVLSMASPQAAQETLAALLTKVPQGEAAQVKHFVKGSHIVMLTYMPASQSAGENLFEKLKAAAGYTQ